MVNKQLLDYVQNSLEGGASIEQITPALIGQGWNIQDINEAKTRVLEIISQKANVAVPPPAPLKKNGLNSHLSGLSASQILLYLGGLIIVLAGIIYVGINWTQWGSAARIGAILFPMIICYAIGVLLMRSHEQRKKQGEAFVTVGALLFPFFLLVLFNETAIFSSPYDDHFNLTVGTLTLLLYMISAFVLRNPIWTFLYHLTGLFVFYFFLKIIGVDSIFVEPTMAWLFLIIGVMYVFLSRVYDRRGHGDSGVYSYSIGSFTVALSFIRLFVETFTQNMQNLSWLIVILGAVYFMIGIYFEERGYKKYTDGTYFIGAGVVFILFMRLGMGGDLIRTFIGQGTGHGMEIVGWSNVIVGIVYLLIGFGLGRLDVQRFKNASGYKEFFNLVAPFWILGSILYLGLDGHKPVYETLLLISSLGFIFGSIPKLSRSYLLVGMLFLVIYIFSMGSEYFQNQVGWPITLFIAGLMSMGVGVVIDRVRKKYFVVTQSSSSVTTG